MTRVFQLVLCAPVLLLGCYGPQGGPAPAPTLSPEPPTAEDSEPRRVLPAGLDFDNVNSGVAGGAATGTMAGFAPPPVPVGAPLPMGGSAYYDNALGVTGGSLTANLGRVQLDGPSTQHYGFADVWDGDYPQGTVHMQVATQSDTGAGMMALSLNGDVSALLRDAMTELDAGAERVALRSDESGSSFVNVVGCSGAVMDNWDWDVSTENATVDMMVDPADSDALVFEMNATFDRSSQGTGVVRVPRSQLEGALRL